MRMRPFLVLSAVTAASVAAAAFAVSQQPSPRSEVAAAGPMLPGLADRLGDVAAVVVQGDGRTLTIRRGEAGWQLAEHGAYPVPQDKVRALVTALVRLEKGEAKTAQPARHAKIGVEDVAAEGAKSRLVRIQNAKGEAVAELLIGNSAGGFGATAATYVRLPGDPQAWLARGEITAGTEPSEWVERQLTKIPAADIQSMQVVQPDKATLTLVRTEGEPPRFRIAELPDDGAENRVQAAQDLADSLSDLALDDLQPLAEADFPADKTFRVTVTLRDARTIAFDLFADGTDHLIRFHKDAAPATLPTAATDMAFRIPAWKASPFVVKRDDLAGEKTGS